MEIKKTLEKARATALMYKLSGFKEIKHVDIPSIPTEKTLFPGTKDDWWCQIPCPIENISIAIYELGPKGIFRPHLHKLSSEQIIPLTKSCKVKAVTFDYIREIGYKESVFFDKMEAHAVINMLNTMAKFMILWSPKMNGWQGDFLPDHDINLTPAYNESKSK